MDSPISALFRTEVHIEVQVSPAAGPGVIIYGGVVGTCWKYARVI